MDTQERLEQRDHWEKAEQLERMAAQEARL
jgi:hypothetical protein